MDALVDLPFALPTAVAGITLASLYAKAGWIGQWLEPLGIKVANTQLGVFVALTFIGLPFIVRTVQPVLEDLDPELEEAAAQPGREPLADFLARDSSRCSRPALLTGFALAFARALGEYGSVIFIASNIPMKTQITPLVIMSELEMFNYARATAIAVVMLVVSFALLLGVNVLQWWTNRYNTTPGMTPARLPHATARRAVTDRVAGGAPAAHRHCAGVYELFLFLPLVSVFTQALPKASAFISSPSATRWR